MTLIVLSKRYKIMVQAPIHISSYLPPTGRYISGTIFKKIMKKKLVIVRLQ